MTPSPSVGGSQAGAAEANSDQIAFWNADTAQKWISQRPFLDRLFESVTERLMAVAAPAPGENVLDIGCGGGTTSFLVGEKVGSEGRVLGLDVSEALLAHAAARRLEGAVENVAFELGDAQVHQPPSAAHDLAMSRFGVMFFADPTAAFENIGRGLRPGGRLCFVAWAELDYNPWFALPIAAAIEEVGPPAPSAPHAPGPLAFADAARVLGILAAAGFEQAAVNTEDLRLIVDGTAADAAQFSTRLGPAMRILREKEAGEEVYDAVAARITDAYRSFEAPAGAPARVEAPARLHFYTAVKPG